MCNKASFLLSINLRKDVNASNRGRKVGIYFNKKIFGSRVGKSQYDISIAAALELSKKVFLRRELMIKISFPLLFFFTLVVAFMLNILELEQIIKLLID